MLNLLLKQICGLFNPKPVSHETPASSSTEFSDNLDTACAKATIYMREDGEFAIASEFLDDSEDTVEISGTVFHMLNSGLLADYFLQSLYLWGEQDEEQKQFVLKIIKKWKGLFDENDETVDSNKYKLAVDPTDVFDLKTLLKGK